MTPEGTALFICYSHSDDAVSVFARAIADKLTDAGHGVWLDDWCLVPGVEFESQIHKAVERSTIAMIFAGACMPDDRQRVEIAAIRRHVQQATLKPFLVVTSGADPDRYGADLAAFDRIDFRDTYDDTVRLNRVVAAVSPGPAGEWAGAEEVGDRLRDLGDMSGAREQYIIALNALSEQEQGGAGILALATLRRKLAIASARTGDLRLAEVCLRAALQSSLDRTATPRSEVAADLSSLGVLYAESGDLAGALQLQRYALSILRSSLSEEHVDTAAAMGNLANTLGRAGDVYGALRLMEISALVSERILGRNHPDTLRYKDSLAVLLMKVGLLQPTLVLQEAVLSTRRDLLGAEHPDTLTSMYNLACLLERRGYTDESMKLQEEVLAVRRRVLGRHHPDTLVSLIRLLVARGKSGDFWKDEMFAHEIEGHLSGWSGLFLSGTRRTLADLLSTAGVARRARVPDDVQVAKWGDSPESDDSAYLRLSTFKEIGAQDKYKWLNPYARNTGLVGRQRELDHLKHLTRGTHSVQCHVVCGDRGVGKTSIALRLCEHLHEEGWDAGFAEDAELRRFLSQENVHRWSCRRPTLVVVDDAEDQIQVLERWLNYLSDYAQTKIPYPLMVILLSRSANLESGWAESLFGDVRRRRLLALPEFIELPPLTELVDCLWLIDSLRRQIVPDTPLLPDKYCSAIERRLRTDRTVGNPLYLCMLAYVSTQEPYACYWSSLNLADMVVLIASRWLKEGIAPAQSIFPEILNEAVLLVSSLREVDAERDFCMSDHFDEPKVRRLIRCVQDFSPERLQPARWLELVERSLGEDLISRWALSDCLNSEGGILPDFELLTTQRLIRLMRRAESVTQETRAELLRRLAMSYARASRPVEGLQTIQDAVALYRELASIDSQRFSLKLVTSLLVCARFLCERGENEEALEAVIEAAEIYKGLTAGRSSDSFGAHTVLLTSDIAVLLSRLGRWQEALTAAAGALSHLRGLGDRAVSSCAASVSLAIAEINSRLASQGDHAEAIRKLEATAAFLFRESTAAASSRVSLRYLSITRGFGRLPVAGTDVSPEASQEPTTKIYRLTSIEEVLCALGVSESRVTASE
ncbi:MAG: hypothetical protein JWL65_4009 [Gammaproteobacteria bacterium]|nr:hypothetical protein [Gammaproteobacteria bacterium]